MNLYESGLKFGKIDYEDLMMDPDDTVYLLINKNNTSDFFMLAGIDSDTYGKEYAWVNPFNHAVAWEIDTDIRFSTKERFIDSTAETVHDYQVVSMTISEFVDYVKIHLTSETIRPNLRKA